MVHHHACEAPAPAPDHRAIGRDLGLFHIPPLAQGQVFWEPRGLILLRELEAFVSALVGDHGYQEVRSPLLWREELWQRSGHAEKFDGLYRVDGGLAMKPVACPAHCAYYLRRPRTLAELPLRLAELGCCHRNEQSGELQGLLRLRGFVQDDAHIFAAPEQVAAEIAGCLRLAEAVYRHFGLEPDYELSLRPPVRYGADELWDRAEADLRAAIAEAGLAAAEQPGEGAFYGPKIDLHVRDALGRRWQLGTVQVDYVLPELFDLRYRGAGRTDGGRPVMIHRALLGALERFLAVLLEHCDGLLPLWLAPMQVRVLPIGAAERPAGDALDHRLRDAGIRSQVVLDGPLSGRIRQAEADRVPYQLIVGRREAADGRVVVRRARADGGQAVMDVAEAVGRLAGEAQAGRRPG
ncbi:MAG TPA: threonine--tRNA ligase [Gaiellales bacterium]|jgi:threonyl-tRNA synthetase|nr:threonine--tRNA ligase [Gaiellales bacterium]